ncbi:MAG: GTPase HflX [Paludibacteraceae bacterium]|nr:GTPase HflX [Paludibacteraceae bacterium]
MTYTPAVLVGLITPSQPEDRTREYLDELAFLADTNHIRPVKRFVQRLEYPNSTTYVGEGKLEEISDFIRQHNSQAAKRSVSPQDGLSSVSDSGLIELVIFDDELSPRQLRNIEKALNTPLLRREGQGVGLRVIDRTILILEIFLQRAQTSYAKTQVEMAHLQYMLPRLTRMWSHLDRQRGGGGTNRGTGETQIEADRRIINNRIALLREDLKRIDKQMATQRQNRGKMVRVALVGYTNVGKSTMMNLLSKSDVFAENKLFATLDTTVRKVTIDNLPFLLSDTVGFIRKLPHNLVESFKSTLDEVREADLLIHVVDISHPNFEEQYEVVEQTINELLQKDHLVEESDPWSDDNRNTSDIRGVRKYRAKDKKQTLVNRPEEIVVFNKIDAFTYTPQAEDDLLPPTRENISLDELRRTWMAKLNSPISNSASDPTSNSDSGLTSNSVSDLTSNSASGLTSNVVFISARNKTNIDELREVIYERVKAIHIRRYPYNDFLFQRYDHLEE